MPRQKMKIDGRRKIIDHIINREKGNLTLVTQSKYKNLTLKDSVNEFKLGEKFDCQNSDTILDHMNGEWAKRNNSAVSGGHLLKGMEDKWGKLKMLLLMITISQKEEYILQMISLILIK